MDTITVRLMGEPRVHKQPSAPMQINEDAEALEIIALLLLTKLAEAHGKDRIADFSKTQEFERDPLFAALHPGLSAEERRAAQDRMRYKLRKISEALSIKMKPQGSERMRSGFNLELAHLSIDAHRILSAARQLEQGKNQDAVIALGAKRLLEGMEYSWLDQPVYRALRRRLDDAYVSALHRKIIRLLVLMEREAALGKSGPADVYRSEALYLIDAAAQRLSVLDEKHPLSPLVSGLYARAAYAPPEGSADGTARTAPAASTQPRNIPRRVTRFIGRETETAQLRARLSTERIVTVVGMGGCGKTRLAVEMAADYEDAARGEAWMVELAGVADAASVPQAVARVLGLSEQKQGTYVDALIGRLRERSPLLLLDNCEHLLEACAVLIEKLVQFCPNLTVLATSREPLNLEGEYLLRLNTMRVPPADFAGLNLPDPVAALLEYESARLFIDRVRPHGVTIAKDHVAAVVSICARLDGIPLALELAAARAAALSLSEIDERLTDRFNLLTDGRTTALPRHQTLRGLIDWSYDLLTAQEQALLRRCSVFAGGWTLDAAQSVAASGGIEESDVPDLLKSLIDKSLVSLDATISPARYGMLETVREYAEDKLQEKGERSATHSRHRAFFLRFAEESGLHLRGSEPEVWLDLLETETDNLRAALAWRADEEAMRLACALYRFWLIRSHFQEGRQWLERTWDEPDRLPVGLKAAALMHAGSLVYSQNNFSEAKRLLEQSLALWTKTEDQMGTADALYHLGITATFRNDYAEAEERLRKSLTLALASGNEPGAVNARQALGRLVHAQDDLEKARACYDAILPYRREQGDIVELADLLMYMGMVATHQDRRAEARDFYIESHELASRLGRVHQVAQVTGGLAELARIRGDYGEAREYCEQSLLLMRKVGAKLGIAAITNLRAAIAYDMEDYQEAETVFEQARAKMLDLGNERSAVGMLLNIASAAGKQGKHDRARKLYCECLTGLLGYDAWQWIASCLEDFGLFEAQHGSCSRAAMMLSAADGIREQTTYIRTKLEKERFILAMSNLRTELGDDAFASASDSGRAMTNEEAVAFARDEKPSRPNSGEPV